MSVFAKFQLPSLSSSGSKVFYWWGGDQVTTISNLNPRYLELSWPFWGPLAALLNFAICAALQVVSVCLQRR